jgi:acyl-CoA synthetase (NDP forming)
VAHRALDPAATADRLERFGVPLAHTAVASRTDEVAAAFDKVGAERVVLKAGGLLHKTDDGGVVLGLADAEGAVAAAEEMVARLGERALPLLLQAQASGVEMLVGLRRDPAVGAAVVVGLGGVATEVHADLARALVPVDRTKAAALLRRLRSWPLLDGYRGMPGADVEALVEVIVAVSRLAEGDERVAELDLNPVMVAPGTGGALAVDARIVVDDAPPPAPRPRFDLDRMLRPRHVAVVGVSDDEHKVGARLFRYLDQHAYSGRLDPVHPSGGEARGRTRYASLADVPGSPDLVCIAVPARAVLGVARQAVEKRVGGVIVHSSDFAEVGAEGRAAQDEVVRVLTQGGIPLAGPNDMGIVAPHQELTASISGGLEGELVAGGVGLLTSSGALGSCLATRLMGAGVGLSHWIHAGNEAGLVIADYLEWLVDDAVTTMVGLLLEDIKDGPRFVEAGRRFAAVGKPMYAYNMVRSEKGRQAALSHTGAMVGSFELREEVIRAAGMVSVPSLQVLEDALLLTSSAPLPAGNRLMVVTFSGGACSIIADEAEAWGVQLPDLDAATRDEVRRHVPSFAAVRNPLDVSYQMLSDPASFERAIAALLANDEFDAVLVQFTTNADPYAEHTARAVTSVRGSVDVPVYVSRYGGAHLAPRALEVYREAGIPVLDAPDRAARAVSAVMAAGRAVRDAA